MTANKRNTEAGWNDPDDAPDLTSPEWAAKLDAATVRRGRPKLESPKELTSIRIDADILARLRESGPGWQSRINDILRDYINRR